MKKTCRSDPRRARWVRRRPTAALAVIVGASVWLLLGAAPGSAHAGLVATTPGEGAQLSAPLDQVRLEFTDRIDPEFAQVRVRVDGQRIAVRTEVEGQVVSVRPRAELTTAFTGGRYEVNYRVVSEDGHPVTGTLGFAVARDSAPTSASTTSPSPSTTPSATPSDVASPSSPTAAEAGRTEAGRDWGTILSSAFILVVALSTLVGSVAWVARGRSQDKQR